MLLKYIVSNYRSIGKSIEFSMIPSSDDIDDRFVTTLTTQDGETVKVLRRGGFFGPNASGKSNFAKSLWFAVKYIVEPQKSGRITGVDTFKGNISDYSTFQFVFYLEENIYEYGFSLTYDRVAEEWLMLHKNGDFVPYFTRITDENGLTQVEIEDTFLAKDTEERAVAELTIKTIKEKQKNQLFLNKLNENSLELADKIIDWFNNILVIFPDSEYAALPIQIKENKDFRQFLTDNLAKLDTGICNIKFATVNKDFQKFVDELNIPDEIIHDILNDMQNKKDIVFSVNNKHYFLSGDTNKISILLIKFQHQLNGNNISMNKEDESDGTQRLMDLLPILFNITHGKSRIYFIDEIDRSLHTKLSRYLLSTFLQATQQSTAQLLFTAHDVNLLSLRDFSKEEIWFVEKKSTGESSLRPFSDFYQVNNDTDVVKGYLNGRFGAVPMIGGENE